MRAYPALGSSRPRFVVPPELFAGEPAEARGVARDAVRLLVADGHEMHHASFRDIGHYLRPDDLVVVNTSAALPAAVEAVRAGVRAVVVHFSTPLEDGTWTIELRTPDETSPILDGVAGEVVELASGGRVTLLSSASGPARRTGTRLWRVQVELASSVESYLAAYGHPITYGHLRKKWPLSTFQTVFAQEPGSAEMPSAARPFTHELVTQLVASGIRFAPITLHAGVSSLEIGESPQAERFHVSDATARAVNETRRAGGRVIAVGTTVMRALETVAGPDGIVTPAGGWTDLVLGPDRPALAVDGLVTGWHLPDTSHLSLLRSLAPASVVQDAYDAALEHRYLWHEFGDVCLLLPRPSLRPVSSNSGPQVVDLPPVHVEAVGDLPQRG